VTATSLSWGFLFVGWCVDLKVKQNKNRSYKGTRKKGKRDGLWTCMDGEGHKLWEGIYKNGIKVGKWTMWYDNGKTWNENDEKQYEAMFDAGNEITINYAIEIDYYDNGIKRSEYTCGNGKYIGPYKIWDEKGILLESGNYKNDIKDGNWHMYDGDNGQLLVEGMYKNGKKDGHWKFFNENGTEIKDGEMIKYLSDIVDTLNQSNTD
jgi:antitoxin component YwqK of YwqJK toxin-antitoxin module